MKRMKRIVCVMTAAAMMMGALAACGGDSSSGAGSSSSAAGGESAAAGTAAEGAAFKIGGIGPVTGGAAAYGKAVENGAMLAVEEINADGGINGCQIEFKFEDDEHDAEKAVNAYNTLKDWGMQMLMGTVTSNPCIAVASETAADNMFQLSPSGSAVECVQNPNAFRICFSDPNQGLASAKYIGEKEIAAKVAVIYDSSDVYSSGIYEKFAAEAENQPFEIVSAEAFTADSKTDFTVQLKKAKDAGAELVFLPIYYQEAALILEQANSMGFATKFFGCDGLDGILGVEEFDTSLAEGVMLLTPFTADSTENKSSAFTAAYEAKYNGEVPIQFAADAYDAIYAIKAAAEQAGLAADMTVSDMCDAMETAMTAITLDGVTGEITWTADGEPTKEPKGMVITDGAYKAMD